MRNDGDYSARLEQLILRLRDYDKRQDGDADEAADELERLLRFIRERVADRSRMMGCGYHARRICLEAEQLLLGHETARY